MRFTVSQMCRIGAGLISLAAIAGIGFIFQDGVGFQEWHLWLGYFVTMIALVVALYRSGIYGYAFWVTLIAAYPLLSPLIVQELLKYPYIGTVAVDYQTRYLLAGPVLTASFGILYISFMVCGGQLVTQAPPKVSTSNKNHGFLILLLVFSTLMLFFAWLAEPGQLIGVVDYEAMRTYGRFKGVNFAGGAWLVVSVVSLGIYLKVVNTSTHRIASIARIIFVSSVVICALYLLAHARRSELSGYILFLFLLTTGISIKRKPIKRAKIMLDWRVVVVLVFLFFSTLIGYVRTTLNFDSLFREEVLQLPGGAGLNLLPYIVGYWLAKEDKLSIWPGETYLGHIQRLPPSALGLDRMPDAYQVVAEHEKMWGGEYLLLEPMINFQEVGVIIYLIIFVLLINGSIAGVKRFLSDYTAWGGFILGGTFLGIIFRTMWYGPQPMIKALIMALLILFALKVLMRNARKSSM